MLTTPKINPYTLVSENMCSILLAACLILNLYLSDLSFAEEPEGFSQQNLIYTPQEMLSFDIETFLQSRAPHLSPYSEVLSHWSGRSSISPKILISLLEYQAGVVSQRPSSQALESALSKLSTKVGIAAQIEDVSIKLAGFYYQNLSDNVADPESTALDTLLTSNRVRAGQPPNIGSEKSFSNTFFTLFPQERDSILPQGSKTLEANALPPVNLFQLPYPIGDSWQTWGGTHSFTGTNSGPRSSLDFRRDREPFGADTSNKWVSSASNGQVVKHSSCFVEVIGSGGWSTNYYHLDNIVVNSSQGVSSNQRLANYADNLSQSLCGGGQSNGPHVHFSLKRNGVYYPLDGVRLSSYTVHTGRTDYDSNCDFFWLDNNGSKICAGVPARNDGIVVTRPDLLVDSSSATVDSTKDEQKVTTSVMVTNIGNASSPVTQLSFRWSTDSRISFSDTQVATTSIKALGSGENTIGMTEFVTLSEPGQYWVGACAIAVQGEINIANNCSSGFPIILEEKPKPVLPPLLLLLDIEGPN